MSLAKLCVKIATREELEQLLIEQVAEADKLRKELEDIKSRSCETCIWNVINGGECLRTLETEEYGFDIRYAYRHDYIDFCSKYEGVKEPK